MAITPEQREILQFQCQKFQEKAEFAETKNIGQVAINDLIQLSTDYESPLEPHQREALAYILMGVSKIEALLKDKKKVKALLTELEKDE